MQNARPQADSSALIFFAHYIPGYKNKRGTPGEPDDNWQEQQLPNGTVTWQHTDGTMANIARRPDGSYCAVDASAAVE